MAEKEKQEAFRVDIPSNDKGFAPPSPRGPPASSVVSNPLLPILSYCGASILMTVTNKYVLSGYDFNLNFFLCMVQVSISPFFPPAYSGGRAYWAANNQCNFLEYCLCSCHRHWQVNGLHQVSRLQHGRSPKMYVFCSFSCISLKLLWTHRITIISAGFPISVLLILMIYTSSKALQFLSIPVYTIFKNLTIILIAYGEVLWFGGSVTGMALFSFGLMVLSSVVAAWADISAAINNYGHSSDETAAALSTLNAGYIWMLINCLSSASYVLGMRKRIKLTNFKDFDSMSLHLITSIHH